MKNKSFITALLLLLCATSLWASNTSVDGIWYDFNNSTMTATVTYRGSAYDQYTNEYTGDVTIPESVTYYAQTYSVTSIGNSAFYGCSSLTSIDIPNSVTSIGDWAFYNCSSLTSVTIPNSVTSIGQYAFHNCSSLTSPVYNEHVFACMPTSYSGDYSIPEGIESIAGGAFSNCSSLTSIDIPNSVTSIGDWAFSNCSSLTSVTIPNSVTSIGGWAFSNCSSLTSVTIPNSVTSIGRYAFAFCSITSVTIPNSVTSIEVQAFASCSELTSIIVESGNSMYDSRDNCNAIIETSTNTLIAGCQNTTIPNSVTSIGSYAFSGCSSLTSVTIPNSVTSIGYRAFGYCISLTSVTIPNSVTSIGDHAFQVCSNLTSVTIPNSVTSIGEYAFSGCSSLISVYNYATTPQAIFSDVFYNVSINTCSLYVPEESIALYKSADVWRDFDNIQAISNESTAIGHIESSVMHGGLQKILRDGQLLIEHNGKTYTVQGQPLQ